MDEYLKEYLPFVEELSVWAWLFIVWTVTNLLLKPYVDAVLRQYQQKFDAAAKKTTPLIKRIFIEIFRIILIATQFPHSILFLILPHRKRLRIWRKNHIVFYLWVYSKHFPNWAYYSYIRKWFEKNIYLNEKTSYLFPEQLKEDGKYINEMLEKDLLVSHSDFISMSNTKFKPIIRVGAALKSISLKDLIGPKLSILWIMVGWTYSISFMYSIYLIFNKDIYSIVFIVLGIILFKIDRFVLTKHIIKYAKQNQDFFVKAVKERIIQINW